MNSRWTTEEKNKLINLYSNKKTFAEIGKILNRSPNAIKLRIEVIIYTNLAKNKSPKDIAKSLNIDMDTLKKHYYSHKSFKENRGEKVVDISFDNIKQNKLLVDCLIIFVCFLVAVIQTILVILGFLK